MRMMRQLLRWSAVGWTLTLVLTGFYLLTDRTLSDALFVGALFASIALVGMGAMSLGGGVDEAAAVWFRRTKRRLASGKKRAASKALGILAHIIGEVAQPMHTDSSDKEDGVHSSYESAVDRRIADYPFRYDGRDAAKPGARTRRVARRAHPFYWDLINAYDAHGYNAKVHRITKRQLKRAANALADLITSLR